jgi:tetratricopeptide (TPR) repeat protein
MRGVAAAIALLVLLVATPALAQIEDDLREGDRAFEDGDWRRAATAFDRAIRKAPTQVPAEAYGKRAAIYIIQKDYGGGLTFLSDVAKKRHPDAPEVLEQEALLRWQTGNRDQAIAVAEKVVAKKPTAFTNQQLLGEYYAGRDPDKTVTAYEAYLSNRPADLEAGDLMPRIRLGFAYIGKARGALRDGTTDGSSTAARHYGKAIDQFEVVHKKFGKTKIAAINADNGLCAGYTGLGKHDQAITVCERIIQDPKRIDANASVWFNLASAYLAKKQPGRARTAAQEFVRARSGEARGQILLGDSYLLERDWARALDHYVRAEKMLKPNQTREQVQLSIKLGKTYRRLPGKLTLAVTKLEAGIAGNPKNVELAIELGSAYLEAKQDAKAQGLAERALASDSFAAASPDERGSVIAIAARAHYNQGKLKDARIAFERARELRKTDVEITRGLVATIVAQSFASFEKKDSRGAAALLQEALVVDPGASLPLINLAVLAIDDKKCDVALGHLAKLRDPQGNDALLADRLAGRAYLCLARPDLKKASERFGAAEAAARKAQANLVLAEVYTEWAPLLWSTDLEGAVDKLQVAVQLAGQTPGVAPAARRNLALALFRRGWKQMRDGKSSGAAEDFERATKDPKLLQGTEPLAFEFSRALALLDKGDTGAASRAFKALAGKGNPAAYLKPPYNKIGTQFFGAYALYRTGNLASRQQAAADLARLQGEATGAFRQKLVELLASAWEYVAWESWRAGKSGAASQALGNASKYADGEIRRRISNNRAALSMSSSQISTFQELGANVPEALVNLGILYDQQGKPREAYDAWVKAKAKGASARDLQRWIDAKKRIYGYR